MNKTHIALATALIASVSSLAHAEDAAPAPAAAASAPAPDWTITGNMALSSDYRTRGFSQSDKKPALSGGFDVTHVSGFYFGNWNSNIDSRYYNGANIEMDFYGGFKYPIGDVTLDLGAFYYYYPGSGRSNGGALSDGKGIDEKEIYVAASYGPVTAKFYFPIGDFFSAQRQGFGNGKNASGSMYMDISGSYDLGNGFGLIGHFGYQNLSGAAWLTEKNGKIAKDYQDWKLGVTYSFANGYVLGLTYIDTSVEVPNSWVPGGNKSVSGATGVFSIAHTF